MLYISVACLQLGRWLLGIYAEGSSQPIRTVGAIASECLSNFSFIPQYAESSVKNRTSIKSSPARILLERYCNLWAAKIEPFRGIQGQSGNWMSSIKSKTWHAVVRRMEKSVRALTSILSPSSSHKENYEILKIGKNEKHILTFYRNRHVSIYPHLVLPILEQAFLSISRETLPQHFILPPAPYSQWSLPSTARWSSPF